jgi:Flp pilus assembly protein TadG
MLMLHTRGRRRRDTRGAAVVEFALVSTVLLPMLFGIVQYGLWFSDTLGLRSGVREAVRAGVVKNFASPGCTGDDMAQLACKAKKQIGAISGTTYVKIYTPSGWTKAQPLVVCAMVKSTAVGLVPLPSDGLVKSRTEMSIEVTDSAPNALTYTDTPPAGAGWGWC